MFWFVTSGKKGTNTQLKRRLKKKKNVPAYRETKRQFLTLSEFLTLTFYHYFQAKEENLATFRNSPSL